VFEGGFGFETEFEIMGFDTAAGCADFDCADEERVGSLFPGSLRATFGSAALFFEEDFDWVLFGSALWSDRLSLRF